MRKLVEVLVEEGAVQSRSMARRMIAQEAVRVDGAVVHEIDQEVKPDQAVQVGKRTTFRVPIEVIPE